MNTARTYLIVTLGLLAAGVAFAQDRPALDTSALPQPGSVSPADGSASWDRIFDVVTHPRCLNCHVGDDNIPLHQLSLPNHMQWR